MTKNKTLFYSTHYLLITFWDYSRLWGLTYKWNKNRLNGKLIFFLLLLDWFLIKHVTWLIKKKLLVNFVQQWNKRFNNGHLISHSDISILFLSDGKIWLHVNVVALAMMSIGWSESIVNTSDFNTFKYTICLPKWQWYDLRKGVEFLDYCLKTGWN